MRLTLHPQDARDLFEVERAKRPHLNTAFGLARRHLAATWRLHDRTFWREFVHTQSMSRCGDGCFVVNPKPRAV